MTARAVQHECPMTVPRVTRYTFCAWVNEDVTPERWPTHMCSCKCDGGYLAPVSPLAQEGEDKRLYKHGSECNTIVSVYEKGL